MENIKKQGQDNPRRVRPSVSRNYVFYLLQEVALLLSVLLVTPYTSRVLGPEAIGNYSYTHSIASYMALIASLGVALYGRREIAAAGSDVSKRSDVFYNIIAMRFMSTLVAVAIYRVLYGFLGGYELLFRIQTIEIVAAAFEINWLFQGENRFHINALHTVVFRVLYTACVFLFVKTEKDLGIYCTCLTLTTLLMNLSLWIHLRGTVKKPTLAKLRPFTVLGPVIALFIPQIAIQVYQIMDKTMLYAITHSSAESGFYEQSHKIINIGTLLMTARGVAITPKLSAMYAQSQEDGINKLLKDSYQFIWFVGAALLFGLLFLSKYFVPWFFGEGYERVIVLMQVFSPICLIIGMSNILTVLYIARKKSKEISIAAITGAVINVVLNLVLIPMLQSAGAAMASVLSEIVVLCLWFYFVGSQVDAATIFCGMPKKLLSAAIGFIIPAILIGPHLPVQIAFLGCGVMGAMLYIIMLLVMRDQYVVDMYRMIQTRLGRN